MTPAALVVVANGSATTLPLVDHADWECAVDTARRFRHGDPGVVGLGPVAEVAFTAVDSLSIVVGGTDPTIR